MMSLLINDDVILGGVVNLEVTDVGNHVGKERVAGYVERHTQTLRRGRIKELSDYFVANKHFENISSFYCIYCSVPSLVTLPYLGYISDTLPLIGNCILCLEKEREHTHAPCRQISGRVGMTTLHCRRRTEQTRGTGAAPSEADLGKEGGE